MLSGDVARPRRRLHGAVGLVTSTVAIAGLLALPSSPAATVATASPRFVRLGVAPRLPAGTHALGAASGSQRLELDIALQPRHADLLDRLAAAVSDPASSEYRHYLSRGDFARRFGATAGSIRRLETALRSEGLTVRGVLANHLAVRVEGRVSTVERAFATRLVRYRLPGGPTIVANTTAPRLAGALAGQVRAVIGLDSLPAVAPAGLAHLVAPFSPHLAVTATSGATPNASCIASVENVGFSADQIANAYGLSPLYSAGDLGSGVSVGLIEFTPVVSSDIATYASCYGLPYPNLTSVSVGGSATVNSPANEVEAELDLEDLVGLAPQAHFILYEGAGNAGGVSGVSAYETYAAAVNDDAVSVLSTSWGSCEPAVGNDAAEAEEVVFEQAALQGQTVVAAAGDQGSEDCYGTEPGTAGDRLTVDDPASQPYVTGVGGTTLQVGASNSESVWNTTLAQRSAGAGGGGVSAIWAMPGYQSGASASLGVTSGGEDTCPAGVMPIPAPRVPGTATAGGTCREVPDVSADAGAPYAIFCTISGANGCSTGGWTGLGGTSAAAPTWAAVFALADGSASCASGGNVGFANPALYSIASSDYSGAFNDITVGSNDLTGTNAGHYGARRGYDLASGLGSPVASNPSGTGLVAELCSAGARAASVAGLPRPTVASVRPAVIRARPGVHVTISGTNFIGVVRVRFGARSALAVHELSPTRIVAVAPTGAGPVHVTVANRGGSSTRSRGDVFTYLVRPRLDRVAPAVVSTSGGAVVLIGANFESVLGVTFGARPGRILSIRSRSRLVVLAPPGSGTVVVHVRTRGGVSVATAHDRLRYTP